MPSAVFDTLAGFADIAATGDGRRDLLRQGEHRNQTGINLGAASVRRHMRINNGVEGFPVENVRADVKFADEDGNPVLASFDPDNTQAKFLSSKTV
ncbi:hypothetical protein [Methylomonas koyamae]|uniref:hypothetical protein n=1 Tax=Methylomonas koyamae TaxID=702114 RepID=UPI0012F68FA3|nr:hypothetical protein [Methylomonas koyamae]